jgi:predicted transcriptional regulator of viral defense system
MTGVGLLKILRSLNKPFYTIADLEKITGLRRESLYVTLKRWVDAGILERVSQGIYVPMGENLALEKIAAQLYLPNYLSFESALARHGILNMIPYTLTFATTRKTKKYSLRNHGVEFRQISPGLFFGYEMKNGIHIAVPEKALLDQIYFACRGKASLDWDETNLKNLSADLIKDYSGRFPGYVQRRVETIGKPLGRTRRNQKNILWGRSRL